MATISIGFMANNFNQSGGKYIISVNFTKLVGFGSLNTSHSIVVIQCKSPRISLLRSPCNTTTPSKPTINRRTSYNIFTLSVVNNSRSYSVGVPDGNVTIACLATDLSKATSAHLLKVISKWYSQSLVLIPKGRPRFLWNVGRIKPINYTEYLKSSNFYNGRI